MDLFYTMLVPIILAGVALYAAARRVDVYTALVHGAGEGLNTLMRIVPSLIALLTAVHMLRASGAIDLLSSFFAPLFRILGIPSETAILVLSCRSQLPIVFIASP